MARFWLLALVIAAPLATAAEPPAQERAARLLENPAFQTEPPEGAPALPSRGPRRRSQEPRAGAAEPEARPLEPTPEPGYRLTVPAGGATVAQVFLWVAIAIGILIGAMVLARAWDRQRRQAEPQQPAEPVSKGPPRPRLPPLGELETLAAAGRFAEAIHLLLLRATARIAPRGSTWPENLTSREILARAKLGPEQRLAFQELVLAVERSLFGGRPLAPGDWQRCRAAFERLGATEAGR